MNPDRVEIVAHFNIHDPINRLKRLKTGETVQVAEDDLEDFIEQNRHLIQVQHMKMGPRRVKSVGSVSNISTKG